MADKAQLISELKRRISRLPPLQDEPDFSTSDQTFVDDELMLNVCMCVTSALPIKRSLMMS